MDSFDISAGGAVTGVLHITRYSTLNQSVVATRFRYALIRNSLLSFLIVLSILSLIGIFVSKRLGKDLTDTSMLAMNNIEALRSNSNASLLGTGAVELPGASIRMAMAVIGILPVMIIYPFIQKYLVKGVVVGAVKG